MIVHPTWPKTPLFDVVCTIVHLTVAEPRRGPYDLLLRVSTHGDWTTWLAYFLEGIRVQAANAAELADRLLELQARYRTTLQSSRDAPPTRSRSWTTCSSTRS